MPMGFFTDFASIPQVFHSLLRQNGFYLLPAVVHDYLYWKQTCTRDQADQILNLGMIENKVPDLQRDLHGGTRRRQLRLEGQRRRSGGEAVRVIPPDRMNIGPNRLWPDYQREIFKAGIVDEPPAVISPSFWARGDMPTAEALATQ